MLQIRSKLFTGHNRSIGDGLRKWDAFPLKPEAGKTLVHVHTSFYDFIKSSLESLHS